MRVHKLSDAGGVEVEGVDLSHRYPPNEAQAIGRLYDEHGLVVFRDQNLTKQQLVDATEFFGGCMIDPPATARDPDVPGIVVISTRGTTGNVVPDDPEKLVGDLEWHTDQGYVAAPNRGKILYSVQVPEEGGKTGFIDGQLTYQALPEEMKSRIDKLHVIQSWNRAESYTSRNRAYRVDGEKQMSQNRFPDMVFPLVYPHPKTAAKILNVPPIWVVGVLEIPGAEGDELVEELKRHVLQPKFQYWHQYRAGDAVIWDNWRSLHAASGTPGRYVRTLWSVVIKNGPELGYPLSGSHADARSA
jgi:taurine dioxygenase